ncbi:9138_t:CDS:2, partial [Acaulospora colombiana]
MPYDLSVVSNAFYGDDSVLNPRKFSGLDSKDVALLVPAKPAINVIPGLAQLKRHSNDPKTWLRRTQYISASESVYKSDNTATTMESRMATLKASNDLLNRTHEEQIAAIEYSFEAANDPKRLKKLEHYKDQKITPVEILPILPDFEMRNRILAHCCFDSDPWEGVPMEDDDDQGKMRQDRATKALVNPMASGNDRFLMLYVPSAESAERLKNKRTFEECKDEERIRVPESYGKTTYLESSYTAPDYDESFWDRYRSDRLHEHEIEQLMRKKHK